VTAPAPSADTLSIIIPAYNEEGAIASIIERSLAARELIRLQACAGGVEIIVVSDGSTDRTSEIAARYDEVRLVSYERNRGYGAAIKAGFEQASGSLLSFLDADGTCDPLFFIDLCQHLNATGADVVIGARLGVDSEMPRLRRLGNRLYAGLLSAWSGANVTDSASGMRVIRRTSLRRLYPLPDGMHFTPAMSTLAIFDPQLTIKEVPMPYRERIGESKLSVLRDGWRFLKIIAGTAITYRPFRLLGTAGVMLLLLGVGYGLGPVFYYLANRRIEEWMIYRLVAVAVALTSGVALVAIGLLAQQTVHLIHEDFEPPRGLRGMLHNIVAQKFSSIGVALVFAGVLLNGGSLVQYVKTGQVTAHWVYVLTGGLLVTLGIEFVAFAVLSRALEALRARRMYITREREASRTGVPGSDRKC
jgi:glycosyltransferase involved in cell wall biosynthesis